MPATPRPEPPNRGVAPRKRQGRRVSGELTIL
jgi:hypothetical protein